MIAYPPPAEEGAPVRTRVDDLAALRSVALE